MNFVQFDPKSIPLLKWSDYEKNIEEKSAVPEYHPPSEFSYRNSQFLQQPVFTGSVYIPSPESVYGGGSVYGGSASVYGESVPSAAMYGSVSQFYPQPAPSHISYGDTSLVSQRIPVEPSDDQLLIEIRRILSTANLMTVTKKQVRDELSTLFNYDLTSRKAVINRFIEEILQGGNP